MSNQVYANNMEVSCKQAAGKSICAFPDVCMTPPQTPATPPGVPIPYPNTGMASDTTDGSISVKISGQEVMLKNKSHFKKSSGNEAGSAPMKGVVTHKITGKVYFAMWSMDVKMEGENVVRHLDMTTHNHGSTPPNALPTVYQDLLAALPSDCATERSEFESKCASATVGGDKVKNCSDDCKKAQKCILVPKRLDKRFCCGENTDTEERTGDHLVEVSAFTQPGGRGGLSGMGVTQAVIAATGAQIVSPLSQSIPLESTFASYDQYEAPTVCVGRDHRDPKHHKLQSLRDIAKRRRRNGVRGQALAAWGPDPAKHHSYATLGESIADGAWAHKQTFPHCDKDCTEAQLAAYHVDQCNIPADTPVRTATVLS